MNRTKVKRSGTNAVLSLDLSGNHSDWEGRIARPSEWLLETVSALFSDSLESVSISAKLSDGPNDALSEAAAQMVRGVSGSAALEFAENRVRVNAILWNGESSPTDIDTLLTYLADPRDAGFTTGATLRVDSPPITADPKEHDGTALVTGGAGGLGRAAAERLIAEGRKVVISDLPGDQLDQAAEELGVEAIPANLSNVQDLASLVQRDEAADVSLLLVHHGVGASSRLNESYDVESGKRSVLINGTSVWATFQAFEPILAKRRSSTAVLLSSVAGLVAEPGNGAYGAAKFAVVGLVHGYLEKARLQGIRLHALCPGPIDTPLMRKIFDGFARDLGISAEEFTSNRLASIPLKMAGAPHHIGATASVFNQLSATGVTLAPTGGEVLT